MEFRAQYRYCCLPQFQRVIELYYKECYASICREFMGIQCFDDQKKLKWDANFIMGLNSESKDHFLRLTIVSEFS